MTDSKEWVTIGIPESTRDKARDRPETYEEIMEAGMKALENEGTTKLYQPGDDEPVEEIADKVADQISMANEPGVEVETDEIIKEIRKLQELVEQAPNKTADRFEEKFR